MLWNSLVVTIAAGTPVRLAALPTPAQRLRITPLIGAGCAVIYVLSQDNTTQLAQAKTNNNFIAELPPATATVPGTPLQLDRLTSGQVIDISAFAIDGAHTGDTVLCSWELP